MSYVEAMFSLKGCRIVMTGGAVIFLISDAASGFITGVTIPVDGGYLTDTN